MSCDKLFSKLSVFENIIDQTDTNWSNLHLNISKIKSTAAPFIIFQRSSTIRLWNELPYDIRSLSIPSSFTHTIKNMYCSKAKKYFNYGVRKENIIHCPFYFIKIHVRRFILGNVYIFSPFGSTRDTLHKLLTLSSGVLSCLLQCKIPTDFVFLVEAVEGAFQTDNMDFFHSSKWM